MLFAKLNFFDSRLNQMYKNIGNNYASADSCSACARQKDCVVCKIKNHIYSLKTIHSQLFRANEQIFRVGEKLECLYVVKSGSFKTFVTNQIGEEQIINFYGVGDIIGFDGLPFNQYMSSAVSLETSSACALPVGKLEEAFEHLIPHWLIEYARNKLAQENEKIYLLGKKSANTRIAAFLLQLSTNYKMLGCSDTDFNLSMSRDDIGNYLGLASETVSRTLTHMKKKGCVKLDRRHVTIVDPQHLQRLAES